MKKNFVKMKLMGMAILTMVAILFIGFKGEAKADAYKGYTLKENTIVSWSPNASTKTANDNWIAGTGHHSQRIKSEWTQYVCASYTDPFTGVETWVGVFADRTSIKNLSAFDYQRYAAENPGLAAAFGQDRNALYNHYVTCGAYKGRMAYYTDGTAIKM